MVGFFSSLFGAVITAVATVVSVVETAVEIVDAVGDALSNFAKNRNLKNLSEAEIIKEEARDELQEVNNEYLFIYNKYTQNGRISEAEKKRVAYLRERRNELKDIIDEVDEFSAAHEINEEPDAFEKLLLEDNRAHILQGQVGVSVFGKKCPNCDRDMLIQWPRTVQTAKTSDFFWGCSGWYFTGRDGRRICDVIMRITEADLNIFTRTDALEAQVDNQELTDLVLIEGPSDVVQERMGDVISDQRAQKRGADDYRCPHHGEELILKQKNHADGLLDRYYLRCPRWKPDNQGCPYMVKLKSVMQLSTLLKKETGTGIL